MSSAKIPSPECSKTYVPCGKGFGNEPVKMSTNPSVLAVDWLGGGGTAIAPTLTGASGGRSSTAISRSQTGVEFPDSYDTLNPDPMARVKELRVRWLRPVLPVCPCQVEEEVFCFPVPPNKGLATQASAAKTLFFNKLRLETDIYIPPHNPLSRHTQSNPRVSGHPGFRAHRVGSFRGFFNR
jgi:hypothetical protein